MRKWYIAFMVEGSTKWKIIEGNFNLDIIDDLVEKITSLEEEYGSDVTPVFWKELHL